MKKYLVILFFVLLLICIIILLVPKKYKTDAILETTNLYSKVTVVIANGKKYISESDLNDVIHIDSEYEEFQQRGIRDEENGIYMHLLTAIENRLYIAEKYGVKSIEMFNENYLSIDDLNEKGRMDFEINGKKLFIKANGENISISPATAINIGLKALEKDFGYDSSFEYEIGLYEKKDYIDIIKGQKNMNGGGTRARITKKGELIETRMDD